MPAAKTTIVTQMYTPLVLDAIGDCLRTMYWFKPDLRSFLLRAGVPEELVVRLPWDQYKRNIVQDLLNRLAQDQPSGKPIIDKLIDSVVEQDDAFAHLRRLEDGKKKAEEAKRALRHLKELLGKQSIAERAERARQERRTESQRTADQQKERVESLKALNERFLSLCAMSNERQRGIEFEHLLRDLFQHYDLDPRGSFACPGEQIDGSITLDAKILLIEAKWTQKPIAPDEVRNFRVKVHDKLDTTLGLLVSMGGFTEQAIAQASSGGRMLIILMDGQEIARIFQGLDDLVGILKRKLRWASEKGEALYKGT